MSQTQQELFRPSRRRGQNFLIDRAIQQRIAASAALPPGTTVVEIGAGTGNLTDALIGHDLDVVAIEVEPTLITRLRKKFRHHDRVRVIAGDARRIKVREVAGGPFHVVANLPYSIGTRLIIDLISTQDPPRSMTVLMQREVAHRICAKPGDMALLSVIVQSYAEARCLFDVDPSAFRPIPKVTSTLLRITPHRASFTDIARIEQRISIARHGFAQTRKKLRNSLAAGTGLHVAQVGEALTSSGIDPGRRPQTLSLDEWSVVAKVLAMKPTIEPV